jgi:pilus assembly protein CpaF
VEAHERHIEALATQLRRRLIERRRSDAAAGRSSEVELPDAVRELVAADAAILSAPTRARVAELILRDTVGLGPLEELMDDPLVEEVMVNGPDEV